MTSIKKAVTGLLPLLVLLCLCGCTHNNGDIGPLFGKWKVTSISSSGVELPPYEGNLFWNFQNTTVGVIMTHGDNSYNDVYGNFRLTDNTLTLDFADPRFTPPAECGMQRLMHLELLELDKGRASFLYHPTEDSEIIYTLKKW